MSYDDIGGRITKQAEWTAFANDEVRPVAEAVLTLMELRNRLSPPEPDETTVGEVVDQDARLRPFLLGGLTDEGSIPEDSVANLTKQFATSGYVASGR